VTTVDLRAREPVPSPPDSTFFAGTTLPSVNTTDGSWNETRAAELRGQFPWGHVQWCDVNVRERWVTGVDVGKKKDKGKGKGAEKDKDKDGDKDKGDENDKDKDAAANVDGIGFIDLHPEDPPLLPTAWAWVRGSTTLTAHLPGYPADEGNEAITYDFYGLHFLANGTYELYALPEGTFLDIRNIPRLFPNHHNITSHIVLAELEKELRAYEGNLLLTDVKPDEPRASSCPLLIHLSVPPIPPGVTQAELQAYEAELANPTGILSSMTRPPAYWNSRPGMGGVIIADQCGFAYGIEHGKGMGIEEFWSKSLNYAAYATISQFIVLILLVRQMEATRTPSTLAKVSLWTIVLIGVSDVWLFSLHLGVGVMSNNKTSLPIIVPGFCVLCTSIVFAPVSC
jgi:hypothetical protein